MTTCSCCFQISECKIYEVVSVMFLIIKVIDTSFCLNSPILTNALAVEVDSRGEDMNWATHKGEKERVSGDAWLSSIIMIPPLLV